MRAQTRYPYLRYAMLLSPQGRVLGHSDPAFTGQYISDPTSLALLRIHNPNPQTLQNDARSVDVAEPVLANGRLIGWARVGIGQEHIANGLALVTRNGLIYTAMAILFGTAFALLMARGLTSDLRRLSRVATRVKGGSLNERADVRREDEIGLLAAAFNRMLDALHERAVENEIAHQKLANSQAQFAAMFRAIPDAVIVTDDERRVRMVNPATEAMFGYTAEELQNRNIEVVYASREEYEATAQLGSGNGTQNLGEARFRHRDGRLILGQILRAAVYDSGAYASVPSRCSATSPNARRRKSGCACPPAYSATPTKAS
ncbi:PAS domain S-box protein [Methylogaea oryzae]|uniref:PAS domain S-box protein n=1 Tax=Methylogaea oryzae TaxID=1295382 RepID=UPI0006D10C09|nr:PAS domain S-box protein [Methylogaea oryzae]